MLRVAHKSGALTLQTPILLRAPNGAGFCEPRHRLSSNVREGTMSPFEPLLEGHGIQRSPRKQLLFLPAVTFVGN
eukprot:1564675-Amphidinium_carterae.1